MLMSPKVAHRIASKDEQIWIRLLLLGFAAAEEASRSWPAPAKGSEK